MSKYVALAALFAASLAAQDAASLIQSGEQAVRRGQYADADMWFAKAAATGDRPETIPALWYLGARAAGSGNRLAAEGFFERVLKVDAKGPYAGRALTWMGNLRQDDAAGAESLFRQALTMEQPGTLDGKETARSYAFLLRRQGRNAEADALEETWGRGVQVTTGQPPQPLPAGVYRVGGGVRPPALVSKVEPQYTEEAKGGRVQGTVVLSVDIEPQGTATNVEVIRSLEPGLDQKAVEAVRQWQFKPGQKDGASVTVRATIEVNFRLN
jgi:TonB family protein